MSPIHVVEQEFEKVVGLFVIPAHDTLSVGRVHEQSLLTGHWVHSDYRVDGLGDGTSQHGQVSVITDLAGDRVGGSVICLQAFEALTERRRQTLKSANGLADVRKCRLGIRSENVR